MTIAVLGANGQSGKIFIQKALARNHTIRAGVCSRSGQSLKPHKNLTIIHCDATNIHNLKRLLISCDAVVSLIGHTKYSTPDVQTIMIQNVIAVMKQYSMTRLISLTGTGVRLKNDRPSYWDKLANTIVRMIDPKRVEDGINHVRILQKNNSAIQWTVVRVLKLTNRPYHSYALSLHGPSQYFTSRCTVASAILDILEQQSYIHAAPVISPSRSI